MADSARRKSNHSIDRFLLVTMLRRFYRESLIFLGPREELRRLEGSWTQNERETWATDRVLTAPVIARAMNVWLYDDDAEQLKLEDGAQLGALKEMMRLQYAGDSEIASLRALREASPRTEVGIQRKTAANLLGELAEFEQRLRRMRDETQADSVAARLQGFRLRACGKKDLYRVTPVGQTEHNMAAVQTAFYPFLGTDDARTVLDGLLLSEPGRQAMDEVLEGRAPQSFGRGNGLTEMLARALDAVRRTQEFYSLGEGEESEGEFWYELRYHTWKWTNGRLRLVPRKKPVRMLPWQVVYSNGYFYLAGLRLDLDPAVTGGKDENGQLVFSNLRLDRVSDLRQTDASGGMLEGYSVRDLRRLGQALGGRFPGGAFGYRNDSTIMYSGVPETLYIDCDESLMNSAVDDFGRENLAREMPLARPGWVRIRVKQAVWEGAKLWLLQHAEKCVLSDVPGQEEKRRELEAVFAAAARRLGGKEE